MKKRALFLLLFAFTAPLVSARAVGIHKTNFYLLQRDGELLYPVGANIGFLMNPAVTEAQVRETLSAFSNAGGNMVRVNVDDAIPPGGGAIDDGSGALKPEVLQRLDVIIETADALKMTVVLSFFDVQRMVEKWNTHPLNKKNGGSCATLREFFENANQRMREQSRIKQLVARFMKYDGIVWEIARGLNADYDDLNYDKDFRTTIVQWTVIMINGVKHSDPNNHLVAVSFMPNTIQDYLTNILPIDLFFLHIRSSDPQLAVISTAKFIETMRNYRKPVFIGETTWTGAFNRRREFNENLTWGSLAAGSGTFLTVNDNSVKKFSDEDLSGVQNFARFLPDLKLDGPPRPPATDMIKVEPEDSYILINHVIGNDWIFWLGSKSPGGTNQANITFYTIEGWYEYFWYEGEIGRRGEIQSRKNMRRYVQMASPTFSRHVIGRLRYSKPLESPQPSSGNVRSGTSENRLPSSGGQQ